MARALINHPKIIFADEPSGSLDVRNAATLHALFFELREKLGQTFVLATHNPILAAMADRKVLIQDGALQPCKDASHLKEKSEEHSVR